MSTLYRLLTVAVVFLFLAGPALSETKTDFEEDHVITLEFATPHTDWAQPYAQGKMRVLVFTTPRNQSNGRECAELMQRFDVELQTAFYGQDNVDRADMSWIGGDEGIARMARLLKQPWDCFLFIDVELAKMPVEQRLELLKQVSTGAGIVLVGVTDPTVLKPKNRADPLPTLLDVDNVQGAYNVLRGRGVQMTAIPTVEYREGWQAEYDHWQQRLGRALLWAAQREPKSRLNLSIVKQPQRAMQAALEGQLLGEGAKLHLSITRDGDAWVAFPPQPLATTAPVLSPMPALPAGHYYVDGRVVGSKGVETWACYEFNISSARSVAAVETARESGEVGETVRGSVRLEGEPRPDEKIVIQLRDRNRRVLARFASAPDGAFSFKVEPWMPMLLTVEATLFSGERELARAYRYFNVTKREQDRFQFVMWGTPQGHLAPYAYEAMIRYGVTAYLQMEIPRYLAAYDTALVPYTTRIAPYLSVQGKSQHYWSFSWSDANSARQHAAGILKKYQQARRHGVYVWSLGDEVSTQDCDLSDYDRAAYRIYLKEVYGTLDALNTSWGTTFKAWDDVVVSKPPENADKAALLQYGKTVYGNVNGLSLLQFVDLHGGWDAMPFSMYWLENEEAGSWLNKNYSRWFDRQAFKSWNFARLCAIYGEAFRSIDPLAKTGVEGAGRFELGDDIDLIVRNTGWWAPYATNNNLTDEVLWSIAPKDYPHGNWFGYETDAQSLLFWYWRMVTRGSHGTWYWMWEGIGRYRGWLGPDYHPSSVIQDVLGDTRIIREGLGDLLVQSDKLDDGVGILFSHPSLYAHKLENGESYGACEKNHDAALRLVRNLGLQPRYVTDRMLRQGEFPKERFKVLLLPRADALGDKEAAVIEQFVRDGGLVIADVRPGMFTDRCKLRERGALDNLFGIRRTSRFPGAFKTARSEELGFGFEGVVDMGVSPAGGSVKTLANGVPALLVNSVGKGKAVLLNFPFASYPGLAGPAGDAATEFLAGLLAEAGVKPPYALRAADGTRLKNVELVRWRDGGIQILALWRGAGAEEPVEIVLPQPAYVRDLRYGKDLGRTDRVQTRIRPARATFLALSPEPFGKTALALEKGTVRRGELARVRVSVPQSVGRCPMRLEVLAGDHVQEWQTRNLLAGKEAVSVDLPVAFNDPAGKYRIRVTNVFTGEAESTEMEVAP